MRRFNTKIYERANVLGASTTLATTRAFPIGASGHLSLQVFIDRVGDGMGSAPSDTPQGTWGLWCSGDGVHFSPVIDSAVTVELAKISPNGNNVVSAWAVFDNVPGTSGKLIYTRTSGGGTNSLVTLNATAW